MKAKIQILNQPLLRKCANILTSLALCCLSAWLSLPGHVMKNLRSLSRVYAVTAIQTTLTASLQCLRLLFQNKRHFVGVVMLGTGVVSYFAGSIFFSPSQFDHGPCHLFGIAQCFSFETRSGWCLMSWYLYLDNTGWAVAALFISVAIAFLIPRNGLHIALAVPVHAIALTKILHVSFFARSHDTYTAFPDWQIIVAALTVAVGIILTADYVIHAYNHRELAFQKRLLTLYNGVDLVDDRA